jgi:hypothetical protein
MVQILEHVLSEIQKVCMKVQKFWTRGKERPSRAISTSKSEELMYYVIMKIQDQIMEVKTIFKKKLCA